MAVTMGKRYIPTWRNSQWIVLDKITEEIWTYGDDALFSRENAVEFSHYMNHLDRIQTFAGWIEWTTGWSFEVFKTWSESERENARNKFLFETYGIVLN